MAKLLVWYSFSKRSFLFNIKRFYYPSLDHNLGDVNQFDYVLIKIIEPRKKRRWF